MPRRMAYYDYARSRDRAAGALGHALGDRRLHPADLGLALHRTSWRGRMRDAAADAGPYRFSVAVHPAGARCRSRSTRYALWVALMIGLTVTNYGYPILTLAARSRHLGARRLCGSAVMSTRELFTFRNRYFAVGVGVAAALFVLTGAWRLHRAALRAARAASSPVSGTRSAAPPACRSAPPPSDGRRRARASPRRC